MRYAQSDYINFGSSLINFCHFLCIFFFLILFIFQLISIFDLSLVFNNLFIELNVIYNLIISLHTNININKHFFKIP